ncbi:MAG: hypothetical protein MUE85_12775 [Microscillaceae bacterium]|nr:hypothetical protein [Microscillaceae bacterium]
MSKNKNNKKSQFNPKNKADSEKDRNNKVGKKESKSTVIPFLSFSFQYFDKNQIPPGQSFKKWEQDGLLSSFIEKIFQLSSENRKTAQSKKMLSIYGEFPPKNKTDFKLPVFSIPENAEWGTIQDIGGQKVRVAGFIIDNIFYIVFFDKEHKFWKSDI